MPGSSSWLPYAPQAVKGFEVCSSMRANRGIPHDLVGRQALERREVSVLEEWRRNGASVEQQDLCK